MAGGCDLQPPEYDLRQWQCSAPLPPQFANCRITQGDCGCATLECTLPCTGQVFTYKLTQEACGVYTCVENGYYYMVTVDVVTHAVTVCNCVRTYYYSQVVVYTLNTYGVLCTASLDSRGAVVYAVVTRISAS